VTEERELISRAQRGERDAFQALVEQHKRNVFFLALDLSGNRQDAEDLSQDVFIRAFRYLKNFRGDAKFGSWLYRITVNCYLDSRRKKQMLIVSFNEDLSEENYSADRSLKNSHASSPENEIQASDLQLHIRRALAQLSPRERSVFVLRHYQEMPLKEIAAALDIAEGTVKSLLFRAIKRLQKALAWVNEG